MPFNGIGTFTNPYNWTNDAANNIDILASRMDTQDGGIATGLSNCICKDGQQATTAIIPFSGGGISLAAGTLLAPSCSIIGDSDTGLAQVSGAGTIAFISNGSKILTFSGTGLNGPIGATTPGAGAFTTITGTSSITLGANSGTIGSILLKGSTSGTTTVVPNVAAGSGTLTLPVATDTLIGKATTDTLTNKTFDTAGTGNVFKVNGVTITHSPISQINVQTFTSSGTYTPTSGMIYCTIECWGGGGAGGGVAASSGNGCAGGGGAGSYSRKTVAVATIGASKTVTIGAGGTAGSSGNNPGNNGADTSVTTICIAKGGTGGNGAAANGRNSGGLGGVAGTGDITGTGQQGGIGISVAGSPVSGSGGSTSIGSGGGPVGSSGSGASGVGFGAGGSGGLDASSTNQVGGVGTAGFVIITEYLST